VVSDELEIFELDGLMLGELGTEWVPIASGDSGFKLIEPSKRIEEKRVANPPSYRANY
jgi:hypothetical protein